MKIISYIRCYRQDPDPVPDPRKKVSDPDSAGQKSTNPTGFGSLSMGSDSLVRYVSDPSGKLGLVPFV